MNYFISGGCKNGKSSFAQNIAVNLADGKKLYYVATMIPYDGEDRNRIQRHLENRAGMGFETLEVGRDILSCLEYADENGIFLVDSVTALLMNEMFHDAHGMEADKSAAKRCADGLLTFVKRVSGAVFVSDYIYSDSERYDETTEEYRRALAFIDRTLADVCENVVELCAGISYCHKGAIML